MMRSSSCLRLARTRSSEGLKRRDKGRREITRRGAARLWFEPHSALASRSRRRSPTERGPCKTSTPPHASGFRSNVLLAPKAMTSRQPTTEETRVVIRDFKVARALDAERANGSFSNGAGILGPASPRSRSPSVFGAEESEGQRFNSCAARFSAAARAQEDASVRFMG